MFIQSKKVWIANQFFPAILEITDGKITDILPYGTSLLHGWGKIVI